MGMGQYLLLYQCYLKFRISDDKQLLLNSGSTYEKNVKARDDITLTKVGLEIAQKAENYEEFVERQGENESRFMQRVIE